MAPEALDRAANALRDFRNAHELRTQAQEIATSLWNDSLEVINNSPKTKTRIQGKKEIKDTQLTVSYQGEPIKISFKLFRPINPNPNTASGLSIYVDGESLASLTERSGKVSPEEFSEIYPACRGIIEAKGVLDFLKENPDDNNNPSLACTRSTSPA